MIRSIIFDWGGVLIDNPSRRMFPYLSDHVAVNEYDLRNSYQKHHDSFQKGQISEKELWQKISRDYQEFEMPDISLWKEVFGAVYHERKQVFNLASMLHDANYKIDLLSNTEAPAVRFFRKQKYKIFDATIFSCEVNCMKPEAEVYNIALDRFNSKPNETIFIDDRTDFVDKAKELGIHGIVYKEYDLLKKDIEGLLY
jgi:putative hydrolase of the HAD superfamily